MSSVFLPKHTLIGEAGSYHVARAAFLAFVVVQMRYKRVPASASSVSIHYYHASHVGHTITRGSDSFAYAS